MDVARKPLQLIIGLAKLFLDEYWLGVLMRGRCDPMPALALLNKRFDVFKREIFWQQCFLLSHLSIHPCVTLVAPFLVLDWLTLYLQRLLRSLPF